MMLTLLYHFLITLFFYIIKENKIKWTEVFTRKFLLQQKTSLLVYLHQNPSPSSLSKSKWRLRLCCEFWNLTESRITYLSHWQHLCGSSRIFDSSKCWSSSWRRVSWIRGSYLWFFECLLQDHHHLTHTWSIFWIFVQTAIG